MGLIPFDVEKAKAGAKIVTASGRSVRIIEYNRRTNKTFCHPIVALIDCGNHEIVCAYHNDGCQSDVIGSDDTYTLYIEEPERWINVYQNNGSGHEWSSDTYTSKEEAEKHAKMFLNANLRMTHVGTFKLVKE